MHRAIVEAPLSDPLRTRLENAGGGVCQPGEQGLIAIKKACTKPAFL